MQRREFLAASTAAALALASGEAAPTRGGTAPAGEASDRQLIELRTYHFSSPEKRVAFEQFLAKAALPALARAGVAPAGVFKLLAADNPDLKLSADANDLYVLLPHPTPDSFFTLADRLAADESLRDAGRAILTAPKSDPAYVRYEAALLLGFPGFPRVKAPAQSPGRLLQLRVYESHSVERAMKKIEMFDKAGEITIFKKVGLNPVFFGQNLAGGKMPCLTYMVAFEDEKAMKAGWDAFRADSDWKKLSADEAYKDTVSNITNLVLRPADGSQV